MKKQKYQDDLKEIREIMERSSRFISLSGLSGISAGIIALFGAAAAYYWVYSAGPFDNYDAYNLSGDKVISLLLLIGLSTLFLAIIMGIYFTTKETRKRGLKVWTFHTKRLIINLVIPLVIGGLVCLTMLFNGNYIMVPALTLIFYGLALINASKYTIKEIRSLGVFESILGLIALQFPGYGLVFWVTGFGLLHIIYGIIIPNKQTS